MTPERPAPAAPAAPTATYRLQLQPSFPFAAAEAAVPWLAGLGVSHLHLSPVLEAVPGSAHGYDVVDHSRVREELGGEDGLRSLARTARGHGLGLVADLVPNHMAAAPRHNRVLWRVLRDGPSSPYARWFDIDWEAGGGKVLLPFLGGPLGGELDRLTVDGDTLRYFDHAFPLRPGTASLPLPELLDAQFYRLCWWRLARTELNYRRFFTIADLIGVRVEDPSVFAATHAKILQLLREDVLAGLRIDHPDGLADPAGYLRRLRTAAEGRWTVVEKILADGEALPADWQVAGTTGYDALRHIDGLFVDPDGAGELLSRFREIAAPDTGGDWAATVRRAAGAVVTDELAAEVERLTRAAHRFCLRDPALRDHAPWALRTAIRELLVRLPVYRPYDAADVARLLTDDVVADAATAFAVPAESAVRTVRDLLLGRLGTGAEQEAFRDRFAQTASALRAKSVEDTAFYRHTPLLSACEVGGEPGAPAVAPADFHAFCARLQRDWPLTGTVLTTHDTKRSADVRARITALAECPERWTGLLADLAGLTGPPARDGVPADGAAPPGAPVAPDPQLAWAAWQSAVGLGEVAPDRLGGALLKHAREAGLHTTWTEQDPAYERALADFTAAGPGGAGGVKAAAFAGDLAPLARVTVLGSTALHLTMPGVPDLYQGTEHDYRALVDPDNRRPVAFGPARSDGAPVAGLSQEKQDLTVAALQLRRRRPGLFGADATYRPLAAVGDTAGHCVAFVRSEAVLCAVTRLSLRLAKAGGWGGTELVLPPGEWRDLLTRGRVLTGPQRLADLLGPWPVALLERLPDDGRP